MISSNLAIVEALLFAAGDEGLSINQLAETLELDKKSVRDIISELTYGYTSVNRGIQIAELGGVLKLVTKKEMSEFIQKLVETPSYKALSQAALEILAIVAYKQPISRIEIEGIRGVKCDHHIRKLNSKALIREVGRAEGLGQPILYGTTKAFLDYFGLKDLKELPNLDFEKEDLADEELDLFSFKYQEEGYSADEESETPKDDVIEEDENS